MRFPNRTSDRSRFAKRVPEHLVRSIPQSTVAGYGPTGNGPGGNWLWSLGCGAPGLAGAARHKVVNVFSAFSLPNRSRSSLRNWPARRAST